MEKAVDQGFRKFHGMLTPAREEAQATKKHKALIETCLQKKFGAISCFLTGSFGNGTSIRGYSDVDYFTCIPSKNFKSNSFTMLQDIQNTICEYFPKKNIFLREPAIVIHFEDTTSVPIEIVPAKLTKEKVENMHLYEIANGSGNGGWLLSSPGVHNKYVDEIDRRFNGRVKQLVSFLKAWKYSCGAPIKSFYLEIFVTTYASSKKSIHYSKDIKNILTLLWNTQLAALKDPKGISGPIQPCSSQVQKNNALQKSYIALKRAKEAYEAEKKGDVTRAFHWWNRVFARRFSSWN